MFVEMDVMYWRKDGSSVTLPCADIVRFDGDKIQELRMLMDGGTVFNASIVIPAASSVMTVGGGGRVAPPGFIERIFFQRSRRRGRGHPGARTEWGVAGPKWNI